MKCPTCGRHMRFNIHGGFWHCCGWQIIIQGRVWKDGAGAERKLRNIPLECGVKFPLSPCPSHTNPSLEERISYE